MSGKYIEEWNNCGVLVAKNQAAPPYQKHIAL